MLNYQDLLKDVRWQRKKNKILQRDNFRCQNLSCLHKGDNKKILHVHHLDYIPNINPWDYPDDMLLTLCEACHRHENERIKVEKYILTTLKR
jgi:5-methylcytosine-specific restriction endonuclease McrA